MSSPWRLLAVEGTKPEVAFVIGGPGSGKGTREPWGCPAFEETTVGLQSFSNQNCCVGK